MAITSADLVEIDATVWFPGVTGGALTTLLNGFVTDAVAHSDDEDAQTQWAYYRAATAVADRLATTASQKTLTLVDQGSKSETTGSGQFEYWAAKAAGYLAAYNALVAEIAAAVESPWPSVKSLRRSA